jgi:hypothetical protein
VDYTGNTTINQNVTPGVFFYWVKVTVGTGGSHTFTITQTITPNNFTGEFDLGGGSNVFTSNCGSVSSTITQDTTTGTVTVQFTAPAGTYIIGLKYSSKSIAGDPVPSPGTTAHFFFTTNGDALTTQPLDLVKR